MDWDKNGMVNFKEFLFAFTRWIGIDDLEDEDEDWTRGRGFDNFNSALVDTEHVKCYDESFIEMTM